MSASRPAVIVLAAGEGTRMKSSLPKVLHKICGRTMLDHVLVAARELNPAELIVVVGHGRDQVMRHLAGHAPDARAVVQRQQFGTGHAVRTAMDEVGLDRGTVMVTYGDTPLLRGQTLAALLRAHAGNGAAVTALTAVMTDPTGYGRIVRDPGGGFAQVVEEADATPAQRAIAEVNSGIYAFGAAVLGASLRQVATDNVKGEQYLTDVIAIARANGHQVASVLIDDSDEVRGVNDRVQLAQARRALNARLLDGWMRAGVTIVDPVTTSVESDVMLAPDVEIGPGTQLEGRTVVESGARIGPGCLLRDTVVGRDATVTHAVCDGAMIGPGATVEPHTHLTPGASLGPRARADRSARAADLVGSIPTRKGAQQP